MEDEEVMFVSGRQEVKTEGEERVKSWRKIVLEGVMMMDQKRKKEWKKMRMGVGDDSSNVSTSCSVASSSGSNNVSSSADVLEYAAELLSVSVSSK